MNGKRLCYIVSVGISLLPISGLAGQVVLQNGTIIEGTIAPIPGLTEAQALHQAGEIKTKPFVLIDQEYKRYFVGRQQLQSIDQGKRLIPYDFFDLPKTGTASPLPIGSMGLPRRVTPFDEYGGRTITLNTQKGPFDVVQKITRISPAYVTIEGVKHKWWQGVSTDSLPLDQLTKIIHTVIDDEDPDDRMSVARFFIQAGMHGPAANELQGIGKDFPELAEKVKELEGELNALVATSLLAELRRRDAAGQPQLAIAAAEAFPPDLRLDAALLEQVDSLKKKFKETKEKGDRILLRLGQLEAQLKDQDSRATVAGIRSTIREQLDWHSVSRFDAFLTFADDAAMPVVDRLALGISGWVAGSAKASTDFNKAVSLWNARRLVGEYLRAKDPTQRAELLAELTALESVGPQAIADLIPFLQPWMESYDVVPGRISFLKTEDAVEGWGEDAVDGKAVLAETSGPVAYAAILPPEYSPHRSYPMIVALRPAEWNIAQAASFWGTAIDGFGRPAPGPATQSGYIVIAPQYAPDKQTAYGYTVREHRAIEAAIKDAKKRFNIDSDRVFLTGHGMGGDATFDFALSHSDLFAGAVPISGLCREHASLYRDDDPRLPIYVINGEMDRASREVNASDLGYMMKRNHDLLYCEFVGRGYDYYFEEVKIVLEWMNRLRRVPVPKELEETILRGTEDQHHWLKLEAIPNRLVAANGAAPNGGQPRPRRIPLKARVTEANAILITSAADRHVIRLNESMVNLDERVKVRMGPRLTFNDFVEPATAALLENFRDSYDRQRLFTIRLELN